MNPSAVVRFSLTLLVASLLVTPGGSGPLAQPRPNVRTTVGSQGDSIVAVVNGDVISTGDVNNRARLFALSTGMTSSSEVVDRLRPQIVRQLIDERLRMQEAQRRKIVVSDQQIAAAIQEIEQRNNMPVGLLRQRLSGDGVGLRTLISQLRAQLAWNQVLRELLAEKLNINDAELVEQQRLQAQLRGATEYRVGEIFVPIDDPTNTAEAQRFAETVIGQLRSGAPFGLVAAQFSQAQGALEGGDMGWLQLTQLDPAVSQLVTQMPPGAVSNPVKVPGGFSIVTVYGRREIGREPGTAISLRQVFLPFAEPLDPRSPTEQQKQILEKARSISGSVRSCEQMENLARTSPSSRPIDPGEIRLESLNPPQFRQLVGTLPLGRASDPIVAPNGISVMIVCSREQKVMDTMSKQDVQRFLINERVELGSRQLMRDLRRRASITIK